jgi:hypothetical protein
MGISIGNIKWKARQMGLRKSNAFPIRTWTAERVARLRALFPYHTNNEVAAAIGVSSKAVSRYAVTLGLKKDKSYKAAAEKQRMRELIKSGKSANLLLNDKTVAAYLSVGSHYSPEVYAEMLANKPLIEAKRTQIKFKRLAKENGYELTEEKRDRSKATKSKAIATIHNKFINH